MLVNKTVKDAIYLSHGHKFCKGTSNLLIPMISKRVIDWSRISFAVSFTRIIAIFDKFWQEARCWFWVCMNISALWLIERKHHLSLVFDIEVIKPKMGKCERSLVNNSCHPFRRYLIWLHYRQTNARRLNLQTGWALLF